jgi:hypothetical protein
MEGRSRGASNSEQPVFTNHRCVDWKTADSRKAHVHLPRRGGKRTRLYAAFLMKVPNNFAGVDRVLYRTGRIVVQERGNSGRELTITADRLF